tara:strand:+ start:3717 stop:5018 length:1302 start_codon:yes stop_codon:yes gene_type:complete
VIIENKKYKIGVIGLGYVGLPLTVEFSSKFRTVGFDLNTKRIKELHNKIDSTQELTSDKLKKSTAVFTANEKDIADCNIFIITVPTPIDEFKNPDLKPLELSSKSVAKYLKKNDVVIYESTVYPGATEEFCVPILEKVSKLKFNQDFYCGYSPERINPADNKRTLTAIKKVTSGSNKKIAKLVDNLYASIIPAGTYLAESIRIAEAAKVIENVQRDVNIALINELSMIFGKLGIDTGDVLEAAATKWNFLNFKPGLVGGHCIGVDPYYLTHKSKEIGYHPEMILAGRRINDSMGDYVANSTIKMMAEVGMSPIHSKVLILGLTFKENCPDFRNTKVPDIIHTLIKNGCDITVVDPYADESMLNKNMNIDIKIQNEIEFEKNDVIILAVPHQEFLNFSVKKWESLFNKRGVLMDVKSLYEKDYFLNSFIKHWRL